MLKDLEAILNVNPPSISLKHGEIAINEGEITEGAANASIEPHLNTDQKGGQNE